MVKKIKVKEFKKEDIPNLLMHMSIQSLLDLKATYGRVTSDDIYSAADLSVYSKTIYFGSRVACCVFCIPSSDSKALNVFMYSTTEAYSKLADLKESFFSVFSEIKSLKKNKICSIVYNGNKKMQSVLRANGFVFSKNVVFGFENRRFCLFVGDING